MKGIEMANVWNKYANTAARKHGRPGREMRPKSTTIDAHTHVAVPRAAEYIKPYLDVSTIPLAHFASDETKALNAKQEADIRSRIGGNYDERFADMDAMGVDMQLVMPPPPQLYHTVALEHAVPAAQMINDGVAEFVSKHPDRFIPTGTVPMQDGNEAAKELERCMKTLKFKGVEILTNVAGRELSDPAFAPFWKKAEELDALVIIHPNGFTEGQRLSRFYFNNIIGNPFETTLALHYLIFDGVLERHPMLKILAVHGGGYLGAYSGRIDHAWGARSDSHGGLPRPPTTYLKRVYVDTVVFTPLQLESLVKTFGVDRVVMGTDFPFDMLEADPIGHIADTPGLDDAARAAIAGGNARVLLGL
jgi:aminocarboxymuconate-semialdehyde decarboxylase